MTITHGSAEDGGGVFFKFGQVESHVEMTDVVVVSNVAAQRGGAIYMDLGSLQATRCAIVHNRASLGGGIYDQPERHLDRIDSTIARNESESDGGGLFFNYANSPTIVRTTISDNTSGRNGGGIWAAHFFLDPFRGEPGTTVSLDHSAVVNNTAAQMGGGIYQ